MEAFLPSLTTSATTAASTTGVAGVGGLSAIGMGNAVQAQSMNMSLMQGVQMGLGAFNIVNAISQGQMQAQQYKAQARQLEIDARQEILNAQQDVNVLQQQLLENLSSQNALFAARGQNASSGSAQAAAFRSAQNATRDIERTRYRGRLRKTQAQSQAIIYRGEASAARSQGFAQAAGAASSLFAGGF